MSEIVDAVVLAAGRSRRMGTDKLCLPLGGEPVLALTVAAVERAVGYAPLVVVPPEGPVRALAASRGWRTAVNPHPERGLSESLRTAVRSVSADAVLIFLGDQPEVDGEAVRRVLETAAEEPDGVAVWPRFQGVPGHPVLIRAALFPRLDTLRGDQGARALMGPGEAVEVAIGRAAPPDLDTPDDYAAWQRAIAQGREEGVR
jgi:molybdenum cofactor cytidylyltransferase